MAANNKANVSTIRGLKGGYLFSAPIGTEGAPTKATFTSWLTSGNPPTGWKNLGYVTVDGLVESVELGSSEGITDINQDVVDEAESGSVTESIVFTPMEIKKHTQATIYGSDNVTDESGVLETVHNWTKAGDHFQYVFLFLMKNDRKGCKYIPDGKVAGLGEVSYVKTDVLKREITVNYITDSDGNGCYDWYESTESTAPELTALSGTNLTLSPTFSASTRSYTATTTSTSTTITATAGTGKTVAIKDANGNSYSSGGSVPLIPGKNLLTITVTLTETGATGIYELEITKS